MASYCGHVDIVMILIERKANVNLKIEVELFPKLIIKKIIRISLGRSHPVAVGVR